MGDLLSIASGKLADADNLRKFLLHRGLGFSRVADGTNRDDLGEHRPGLKAKEELGVLSPLINLTKSEIRELSRELGLPTAEKPGYACLLTRLPHGREIDESELNLIEAAENLLIASGYANVPL